MAPEVRHPRVPCPFRPCTARPEVLQTRGMTLAQPIEDLIRQHDVEPASWFGICPASGQAYPPSERVTELLDRQAGMLDRMELERRRSKLPPAPKRPVLPRTEPTWFRNPGSRPNRGR